MERAAFISRTVHIHDPGRRTINEVNLLWREWFDGLYADGATTGRVMVLHLHPWIMGQPWRIRHLDAVLGHITAHAGVWQATGSEIIDWFKAQSGEPCRLSCADACTLWSAKTMVMQLILKAGTHPLPLRWRVLNTGVFPHFW